MGRQFDHVGEICGDFKVIEIDHKTNKRVYWKTRCVYCGTEKIIRADGLSDSTRNICVCERTGNPDYQKVKLIGQKFGKLTVVDMDEGSKNHTFYPNRSHHESRWICQCECGKKVTVSEAHLIDGHTKTCGCYSKDLIGKYLNDLTGRRFGYLQVIKRANNVVYKSVPYVAWECQCDCGNIVTVLGTNLKNGTTKSCGCIKSQGESLIEKYCQEHQLQYEKQFSFDDCRDKYPLPFDFAFMNGNKVVLFLEYDGIQHFIPQRWSNNITDEEMLNNFKEVQRRDKIKNEYCKGKGIPLIRIPYTQKDHITSIMDFLVKQFELNSKGISNE